MDTNDIAPEARDAFFNDVYENLNDVSKRAIEGMAGHVIAKMEEKGAEFDDDDRKEIAKTLAIVWITGAATSIRSVLVMSGEMDLKTAFSTACVNEVKEMLIAILCEGPGKVSITKEDVGVDNG